MRGGHGILCRDHFTGIMNDLQRFYTLKVNQSTGNIDHSSYRAMVTTPYIKPSSPL